MVLLLSTSLQANIQTFNTLTIPIAQGISVATTQRRQPSLTTRTYVNNMTNNNPFNIRSSSNEWVGKTPNNNEPFERFDTMEHGIRAGMKLLQNYSKLGLNTVEKIIHTFAPPTENQTDNYVATVCKQIGVNSTDVLDLNNKSTMLKLTAAIILMEQGVYINPLEATWQKYFT